MSRFAAALLVPLTLAVGATANGSASGRVHPCDRAHLAFALPQVSPPMQTWAVGFAVHNTGPACRLALPVNLRLVHRSGRPLRVTPRRSRLTLLARTFGRGDKARVTWAYQNYCGDHSRDRPVTYIVAVAGIQLRGTSGAPPCNAPEYPIRLWVLFACPRATGPAIRAVTPRRLPLCPR